MDNAFLRDFLQRQREVGAAKRTPSGPTAQSLKAEKKNMDYRIRPDEMTIEKLVKEKATNKEVLQYFRDRIEELVEEHEDD